MNSLESCGIFPNPSQALSQLPRMPCGLLSRMVLGLTGQNLPELTAHCMSFEPRFLTPAISLVPSIRLPASVAAAV